MKSGLILGIDAGQFECSTSSTDLLELVNHYPGKQLCWASDLAEDDGDKAE